MNGRNPYIRRTRGSERRGVMPVPDLNYAAQRRQSHEDKERVLALMRRRKEREVIASEEFGLGNRELPAYKHKAELVANIEAHKAVIVGGETGSGKSTQLPQYLYEAGYDMTIMLVPRRVIADGLGERIREELGNQIDGLNVDETVGIIHGERVERHKNNKILVMTPNTFIKMEKEFRELYGDKKLAIVADEIHEANLFTEIAVGVAAMGVRDMDDWHLVAASATHNTDALKAPLEKLNNGFVPAVEIEGRPHNIEFREEPDLTPMQVYAQSGANHQKTMIFTSGKKELTHVINETRRELDSIEPGSSSKVEFRLLHGELTEVEISHINDPVPEGHRLVIVATPAGMSGITIPGVTQVLTDGTINRVELDDDKAEGLNRRYMSRAAIIQEIGRAGRDVDGGIGILCAPVLADRTDRRALRRAKEDEEDANVMVFKSFNDEKRLDHEPPEIYNTNLARSILSVASLDYDFAELNEYIPHRVRGDSIISAEEVLARLGALDDDGLVTELGRGMDKFPVTPELARGLYEASGQSRSLQHMARAAFIAAAIDVRGIQDDHASEDAQRTLKQIVRSTTDDDFIAQLDLMTKLYERTSEEWSGYEFVDRHGLHPKRVERVRKTTKKILAVMGLRSENIIVTAPTPDEEALLRADFTAGFIDNIYEDVGTAPRSKATLYRNIHGGQGSTIRTISDRSKAHIERGQLVAGITRYYTKGERKDGTPIKHDVIDQILKVDPAVVGMYAVKNGLVQGVWREARMMGDRVTDFEQGMFGSISVGAPVKRSKTEVISERSQEVLVQYVLKNPGRVQRALRSLANDLEEYRKRTPGDVLEKVRKLGAPEDVTQASVTEMIRRAARETVSAHGIEEKLSAYLYSANLTLERYYDTNTIALLNEMSPNQILIANEYAKVHYDNGQPYVTTMTKRQAVKIKGPVYLADGREVLYQRELPGGGKARVSFGS